MPVPARFSRTLIALMILALGLAGTPWAMAQSTPPIATKTTANEAADSAVADGSITTQVKADLLVTEAVNGLEITVSTSQGVVTLAGKLDRQSQVETAVAVAQGIKGVKSVDTRALKIKPAQ